MNEGLLRQYKVAGPDGYPLLWKTNIKHLVREQAGHRCVRCGHRYPLGIASSSPRGEWTPCDDQCTHLGPIRLESFEAFGGVQGTGAALDHEGIVALQPCGELVRRGLVVEARYRILTVHHLDGDKINCRWWNLCALCQRCHLEVQGKVRLDRAFPWPHSEWFRPYVAGFYAWKYGGEDLTRAIVEQRLDELLALGAQGDAVERMPL